jgi:putative MATE family efflux protein
MNALISRALGAGDRTRAKAAVINGLIVQGFFVVLFTLFGFWGVPLYFTSTTSLSAVIDYGIDYLQPLTLFSICMAGQISCERLLQATGVSKYMLYAQIAGTLVNFILDPILIFGLIGFPCLGVRGAAIATVLGQFVAMLVALWFNLTKNGEIFKGLLNNHLISKEMLLKICKIGIPTSLTGIGASIGNYFINRILIGFSASANAAFGVYAKLQNLALMPTQGMSAALVTVYAFFYGKKDLHRIQRSIKVGEIIVGCWNVICFLVFFIFPVPLLSIFSPSAEMLQVGIPCFRIIGLTYLTSGLMTGLIAFFQAIGNTIYSFVVSLSRQVFVRIPIAFWLASFGDANLIWWSWPISEVTSDLVTISLFIYVYRKFVKELSELKNVSQ